MPNTDSYFDKNFQQPGMDSPGVGTAAGVGMVAGVGMDLTLLTSPFKNSK